MRNIIVTVLILILWLQGSHSLFAASLYGVSLNGHNNSNPGPSSLYLIDETTGSGTLIGDIGYAVNSIVSDPTTGLLYGSTTSWDGSFNGLLQIDSSTGAATEIGSYGSDYVSIVGLTINSSGELFGWHEPIADTLVTIDKAIGAVTTVGHPDISTLSHILVFNNSDTLLLIQGGAQFIIDTASGSESVIQSLSFFAGAGGADINNLTGLLWATGTNGRIQDSIIRVTNLEENSFIDIDTDIEYLNALAFSSTTVPIPATVWLFGSGLLGLVGLARRKKQ